MLEWFQHIDELMLHFIHVTASNQVADTIIPFFRNPFIWSPFYLFLGLFMWINFRKQGLWWCAFFFITFVFCDFISASLLKPLFHRIRPCHCDCLNFTIRELVKCGHGYSFPSSHATNHFGMAIYLIMTLQRKFKMVMPLALLWATLIVYSQLYVAVHYPSDILAGAFLGCLIGWFFGFYVNKRFMTL